jgi:single-strand DNA-binding protein
MAGFNQVIIVGNVGRDPEMRYLQSGVPVCNFSVAVNSVTGSGETRQEKTTWFRVAAWRQLAETCNTYVRKGMQVMVIGSVETRAYLDQSGQPQATLELTARDVRFLGSRADAEGSGQQGDYGGYEGGGSDMSDIPF